MARTRKKPRRTETYRVSGWRTSNGRVSLAKGWDSQEIGLSFKLSDAFPADIWPEKHRKPPVELQATPHVLSDLLERHPEHLDRYGPGFTMPHAIQDFLAGKIEITAEDLRWLKAQKPLPKKGAPSSLPLPVIQLKPDEELSFTGLERGIRIFDVSRIAPASTPRSGRARFWLARRWRRLRQRWALHHITKRTGEKLPW